MRVGGALAAAVVVVLSLITTATAHAAPGSEDHPALAVLEERGLMTPQGVDADGLGAVDARSGLTVVPEHRTTPAVTLRPVTQTQGRMAPGRAAAIYEESGYTSVVTGSGTAANAGYAVISDASAPTEYRYDIGVGATGATLEDRDGYVFVKDAAGTIVNVVGRAWATDATGAPVETSYTIDGSTLVQHVRHAGAAHPVVADPRLQCNGVFCTMEYKRAETRTIATWNGPAAGLIAAGCSAIGGAIAGAVCAFGSGVAASTANQALSSNKCVGLRAFIYAPVATTHPVVVNCYA